MRLHHRQLSTTNQALGLVVQRAVQAHNVRVPQKLLKVCTSGAGGEANDLQMVRGSTAVIAFGVIWDSWELLVTG